MKEYFLLVFKNKTANVQYICGSGAICNDGQVGPFNSAEDLIAHLIEKYPNSNIYYGRDFVNSCDAKFKKFIEEAWKSKA